MRNFILAIVIFSISLVGKSESLDSLKLRLQKIPTSEQFKIINDLNFGTVVENNRSIIPLLKHYEQLALSRKEYLVLARIYMNLSLAYYYKGEYDQNLRYGLASINLLDSLGDRSQLGTMYGELGYQMKYRDLNKAFDLMKKGIIELEKMGNPEPLAKIYDNYGVLFEINNQVDSAIIFYGKSLAIKKSLKDSIGIPYSLNNFFMVYMISNKFDSAARYLDESTKIRSRHNDDIGLAENYGYYSQLYSSKEDFKKAIVYNNLSLEKSKKHGYTNLIKSTYKELSTTMSNCTITKTH